MTVLGTIFWLWLAVSVVILVKRRWDRRSSAVVDGVADRSAGGPTSADGPRADDVEAARSRTDDVSGAAASSPREARPRQASEPDADEAASTGADTREEPDLGPGRDHSNERSDGAVLEGAPDRDQQPIVPAVSIAEALSGIRMPCDLAPLTLDVSDLDPVFADLVTTGVDPSVVTTELEVELTRLGYDVTGIGDGEQLAARDGTVVHVKVYDRPASSVGSRGQTFATAPPDGIVVELALT